MSVARICSREVDTAKTDESILTVAQRMHARKVGTIVIINANQVPVGLITDRDLVTRVMAAGIDPNRTSVRDVMTLHPATVHLDAAIDDALRIMQTNQCRRIPVVNGAGTMVGLLSLDDVLQHLAREFQSISQLLREESPQSLADPLA